MTGRFWICAIITTISALVSAGFSVARLFGPSGSDIFERYAPSYGPCWPGHRSC
jgi:hypothetical protein